jgi:hypothetical protein
VPPDGAVIFRARDALARVAVQLFALATDNQKNFFGICWRRGRIRDII